VFVLENNHYAVSTPIRDTALVEDLADRAVGYGMPGLTVDGNDAVAVRDAMAEPIRRARAGEGPSLIECKTYRQGGHHVNDPGSYLPKDELEHWRARDPVLQLRSRLLVDGRSEEEVAAIDARVEALMDEAVEFAVNSPEPSVESFLAEVGAA
jgi:TPP-dependent pyruvate/acetoin dehydrogenase alpha subunit